MMEAENVEAENAAHIKDPEIQAYHDLLEGKLQEAMKIAGAARAQGNDPEENVEILIARDIAERVEKLLGIEGVAEKIRELEKTMDREEVALNIGRYFVDGTIGSGKSKLEIVENSIRTAVAVLTEGVVAAPIEGIAKVDIGRNHDGTEYLKVYYSGPIRSAGGTAQALSVLVADYMRSEVGLAPYKPSEAEIERYVEEITLYGREKNLQYKPTEDEIRTIVSGCPICIDGDPTEDFEVEGYRDLPRVETNRVRGGMVLVITEGTALKAAKMQKHIDRVGMPGWEWLTGRTHDMEMLSDHDKPPDGEDEELGELQDEVAGDALEEGAAPREKFLQDVIAGRPIFTHPSRPGGFRLRYGRSRNSGLATAGINPATMHVLGEFIAPGTQMKIERPGKAAGMVPVDSIEGPTVRLINGDLVRVDTIEKAKKVKDSISRIIDVGEILINYGDFLENAHPLVPASYCVEWWVQELVAKSGKDNPDIKQLLEAPEDVDSLEALSISDKYGVPLHPGHTYLWHDISMEDLRNLIEYTVEHGILEGSELVMPNDEHIKEILEVLLVQHKVRSKQIIIGDAHALIRCLGLKPGDSGESQGKLDGSDTTLDSAVSDTQTLVKKTSLDSLENVDNPVDTVTRLSGIKVKRRAPTRIGGRMGRPEKSKERRMKPPPHVLFPLGSAGGKTRSVQDAASYSSDMGAPIGEIEVELGERVCSSCGTKTFLIKCPDCGARTIPLYHCRMCKIQTNKAVCPRCKKPTTCVSPQLLDIKSLYQNALEELGERGSFGILKGVQGMISREKLPEPIEKGILRAKHAVFVFKDGTTRYDLTNVPLTHFIPHELRLTPEKLAELGYTHDINGDAITDEHQVIELKPQDVILSNNAGEYLLRTSQFMDDLLERYYHMNRHYNAESKEDLIGQPIIGLAPHTSSGVVGRILGYMGASVRYAHPYYHAAKRRNCDGDEDCVMLLLDGLINFSRNYLPDQRGGRIMDAPITLTPIIMPHEIDKEVHNIDRVDHYPLEFYQAAENYLQPKELQGVIDIASHHIGKPTQNTGFKYTHETSNIAAGPANSAYKTLGTMVEKMDAQLNLAKIIRAVDETNVAERVISTHFIPDLMGNLRAFSRQKVRCVKCNTKYRRPPLRGTCKCGGKLILTVHEGSVKKYIDVSLRIAEEYDVPAYTRQRLELIDMEIKSLFESDKSRQSGLADFM